MKGCSACRKTMRAAAMSCSASRGGYWCTREEGHTGEHVACGYRKHEHRLRTWDDDDV